MYLDNVIDNVPELALCLHARGFIRRVHVCHTNDIPWLNTSLMPFSGADSTSGSSGAEEEPIFDPKMIELNALAILRFLRESCAKEEDGTYLLRRSSDGEYLHLYDLSNASLLQQKRWKWFIAMVSHRFAVRIGQYMLNANPASKVSVRDVFIQLHPYLRSFIQSPCSLICVFGSASSSTAASSCWARYGIWVVKITIPYEQL